MLQAAPDSDYIQVHPGGESWGLSSFPGKVPPTCVRPVPSTSRFKQPPHKAAQQLPGLSLLRAHPLCNLAPFDSVCVRTELPSALKKTFKIFVCCALRFDNYFNLPLSHWLLLLWKEQWSFAPIYILPEHYSLSLFSLPLALRIGQVRGWLHCPHFTVEVTKRGEGSENARRHSETWPRVHPTPAPFPTASLPQDPAPEISLAQLRWTLGFRSPLPEFLTLCPVLSLGLEGGVRHP